MKSAWPVYTDAWSFPQEEKEIDAVKDAVRAIRNVRTGMNVPPSKKASVFVVSPDQETRDIFSRNSVIFGSLGMASGVRVQEDKTGIEDSAASAVIHNATIFMPMEELVDVGKEIERLEKEQKQLQGELKRSHGMLSNERFLSKAPEEKVAEEKAKLEKYEQLMKQVTERLDQLKAMQ